MQRSRQSPKAPRSRKQPRRTGYTTSAGWLGYGEEKMELLLRETLLEGYKHFKVKVGISLSSDTRRLTIACDVIGYDRGNMVRVNAIQV